MVGLQPLIGDKTADGAGIDQDWPGKRNTRQFLGCVFDMIDFGDL